MRLVQVISQENDTKELSSILTPGKVQFTETNAMHEHQEILVPGGEKPWYLLERILIKTATRLLLKS